MSKLLYTHITKLIIDYLLSLNKSIPYRSDSNLHSLQDDHPITKFLSTTNDDYKFGMKVPNAMISDAIKKKAGYMYYMAKKVESKKAKRVDKLEEQHVSPIKSGRGKGFMCYGDQVANVPNKNKKDVVPRKTISLTSAEEAVVDTDSDATLYSSSSEESANKPDDANESNMDLSNDNLQGDDDDASHPVYTDAHTTSMEIFPDDNAHHISSLPRKKILYHTTTTKLTFQAKAKKLMQKVKKNMRKFNLEKAVAQKFKEYDQKLEALTNFNMSEAFEKAVQEKVLTEIKKLLPTYIPNVIANYVKPRLNTSVLEVMKTIQINLFTQSSTSIDDLLEMDLKLKLLNLIHLNKSNDTHNTHQQLYDTLYESFILDQDALDAQAAQSSFHKRSHDNQDTLNNREGENKKKRQKDVANLFLDHQGDVSEPKSFERHMSKSTKPHPCFYNNDYTYLVDLSIEEKYTTSITKHYATRYYKEGIEDRIPERWSKKFCHYHFEALNVRRSDDKEYEFSYANLPRLSVNDVEDFTCSRYSAWSGKLSDTLNLNKPTMFFEGIDQMIPFMMTATHKGVMYLNQYDINPHEAIELRSSVKKYPCEDSRKSD
ncbi:hypothetical protein Tco_0611453 [Tanacetum coccineum]